MKQVFVILLILSLVMTLSIVTLTQVFDAESRWFIANVQKYTTTNIPKNTGWKKNSLEIVDSIVTQYPKLNVLNERHIETFYESIISVRTLDKSPPTIIVLNFEELQVAIKNAVAGDTIELFPGAITVSRKVTLKASGSITEPIILRGSPHGQSVLAIKTLVGLQLSGSNIIIDNIEFSGICQDDNYCEHAIQLKGNADNIKIRNNDFVNFNAAIKSSGLNSKETGQRVYPDLIHIYHNSFVNNWARKTKQAVTPIDVVGGDYWMIEANFFADFEKKLGNKVSYGAFLKGGGRFGQFSDNIVACEWKVPYTSKIHVRIGLSFGGGGTGKEFCADRVCEAEHYKGIMKHNLIMNCPTDVGIYINNGHEILISENVVFGTLGLDANIKSERIEITNNNIQGAVRWRNGSTGIEVSNSLATFYDVKQFSEQRKVQN